MGGVAVQAIITICLKNAGPVIPANRHLTHQIGKKANNNKANRHPNGCQWAAAHCHGQQTAWNLGLQHLQ